MARRSRAREVALQLLFQKDQNAVPVPRPAVEQFCRDRLRGEPELVGFALALFDGTTAHRAEIDKAITSTAENWRLTRMNPADRNVLRLGAYELIHAPDPSPAAVVLNEAIELARRFGTADSPGFVNGILDKISRMRNAEPGMRNDEPPSPPADPPPAPTGEPA
jgi:N utilization substance protein B